jgi:hypothetical protein
MWVQYFTNIYLSSIRFCWFIFLVIYLGNVLIACNNTYVHIMKRVELI